MRPAWGAWVKVQSEDERSCLYRDAPREGRMGYSRPKNLIKRTHIDAPREGRMGYSHGMMVQYINDLRCAPRGAHGLQREHRTPGMHLFWMRPARGAWVKVC